jgi:hypothetical protein
LQTCISDYIHEFDADIWSYEICNYKR